MNIWIPLTLEIDQRVVNFLELLLIQRKRPFHFVREILSFPNYGALQLLRKSSWETNIGRPLLLQTLSPQLELGEVRVVGDVRLRLRSGC